MDLGDKHPDLPTGTIKDSPTESQGEIMDLSQFIKDKLTQEELTTIQSKVKELGFDLSKTNLSEKEHLELQQLIFHFRDRFEIDPKKTEVTDLVKFGIAIRDDKIVNTPINRAPYKRPPVIRTKIKVHTDEMLDAGVIRPSTSPWASPVVLVPKKDGKLRFCVDYTKLNDVSKKQQYPLPRLDTVLEQFAGMKYFTTIDLKNAYWTIGVREEDKEKTAFITEDGLFEFNVMPFGLCNAPAYWSKLMDAIFGGLKYQCLVYFIDDILVYSPDFQSHLSSLTKVMMRLRRANLKCKPSKCNFCQDSVKFLGHIVSSAGIHTDPKKIEAVNNFEIKSIKHVRSFLGLTGFYRKFIKDFAKITHPLTAYTKKGVVFKDLYEKTKIKTDKAVKTLKRLMTSAPILAHPDFSKEFTLQVDACIYGIGAVLCQKQNGQERVIAYSSRTLTPAESKWTINQLEALAVVWACEKFRTYLVGNHFTIQTDHEPLTWLKNHSRSKLGRWNLRLSDFNYTIQHKRGTQNGNADGLSRQPQLIDMNEWCANERAVDQRMFAFISNINTVKQPADISNKPDVNVALLKRSIISTAGLTDLKEAQRLDPDLRPFIAYLEGKSTKDLVFDRVRELHQASLEDDNGINPELSIGELTKKYHRLLQGYDQKKALYCFDKHGLLRRKTRETHQTDVSDVVVIPKSHQHQMLQLFHSTPLGGHLGVQKTYHKMRSRIYWEGMKKDLKNFVKRCIPCVKRKSCKLHHYGDLHPVYHDQPFHTVAMDVVGPFNETKSKNIKILVMVDCFTRWPEIAAIKCEEATDIADAFFDKIIAKHGCPVQILTDRGSSFIGKFMSRLTERMGIVSLKTSPYHPQANGRAERFNKFLCQCLTTYVNAYKNDWDFYMEAVAFAYRTAPIEGMTVSPFQLLYGRTPKLPFDVIYGPGCLVQEDLERYKMNLTDHIQQAYNIVRKQTLKNIDKTKENHHNRYADTNATYKKDDKVLVFKPRRSLGAGGKLASEWIGPYAVIKKISSVTYRVKLERTGRQEIVHAMRIKPLLPGQPNYLFQTLSEEQWESILTEEEKAKAHSNESEARIKVHKPKTKGKSKKKKKGMVEKNTPSQLKPVPTNSEPTANRPIVTSQQTQPEIDGNELFMISKIVREKIDKSGNRLLLVKWHPTLSDKPLLNKYKEYIARETRVHGNQYRTTWLDEWIPTENLANPQILKEWDDLQQKRADRKSRRAKSKAKPQTQPLASPNTTGTLTSFVK